jgi:spermidine synthase
MISVSAAVKRSRQKAAERTSQWPSDSEGMNGYAPLLLLFAGGGCAALIYEVVWFQLLQLVIGSTAVSLGLLLAAYMGGLCIGSLLLPRVISPRFHPLRTYALLEFGVGVMGILALFLIPLLGYTWWPRSLSALYLLPPTVLMGASLPALSRWVEPSLKGTARVGYLYSANIAGAVFGCLFAGFYLLRVYDMAAATYAAVAMNVTIAALSLLLSARFTPQKTSAPSALSHSPRLSFSG